MTDQLAIFTAICQSKNPAIIHVSLLCEYAAALKDLLAIRTKQYRARCQGTIRDTKTEGELIQAANRVEEIEKAIGLST